MYNYVEWENAREVNGKQRELAIKSNNFIAFCWQKFQGDYNSLNKNPLKVSKNTFAINIIELIAIRLSHKKNKVFKQDVLFVPVGTNNNKKANFLVFYWQKFSGDEHFLGKSFLKVFKYF